VFSSTHHMLACEDVLRRSGIDFRLVPAPPGSGELCTTAIRIPADAEGDLLRLLGEKKVLVKGVMDFRPPAMRGIQAVIETSRPTGDFKDILHKVGESSLLELSEMRTLIERGEGGDRETVLRAADALALSYLGNRVSLIAGVRLLKGCGRRCLHCSDAESGPGEVSPGLRERLSELFGEIEGMGIAYVLLDLPEAGKLPFPEKELRELMGGKVIPVLGVGSAPPEALRAYLSAGFGHILLHDDSVFRLNAAELAEEIGFLRDNRPSLIGTGNLIPLLRPDLGDMDYHELERLQAVLAVCRLALGDVFLPVPPVLWREGRMAGGNLLVLDVTDHALPKVLTQAALALRKSGRGLPFPVEAAMRNRAIIP